MNATQTNAANASNSVVAGEALKNEATLAESAKKPIPPRVARSLLVSSLVAAAASFKQAITMEVAVCLAVFAQARGTSTSAKKELYAVYGEAGYDAKVGGSGKDYKTVNRRINYAAKFFDSLKKGTVEAFMGDETTDQAALQSIVNHLTVEYNFRGMNDVLAATGTKPQKRAPRQTANASNSQTSTTSAPAPMPELPEADKKLVAAAQKRIDDGKAPLKTQEKVLAKHSLTLAPTPAPQPQTEVGDSAGDQMVANLMAKQGGRVADDASKWITVSFEGATLVVPVNMEAEALGDLGVKLMTLAHKMKGKVDATALREAFKETETH